MVEEKADIAGTNTGNLRLRHATDQLSSLIFLSQSIKVFSSKWKLIRNKVDEILSILASLPPEIQASADNPTLSGIIQSIEETTDYSNSLAQKCIEHSYSGKLLMQSDLDIIFVKFDNNVKSLSELVNSDGFLLNGNYAIVVSRPGPAASRDDIKFYVKDLLCRFKIGRIEMKKQALVSFTEVIQEDERYVKIAMEIDGLVHVLLKFLNSKEAGIQEEALKNVAIICGFDAYKSVLVGIGVVAPLIRMLETGSDLGKELATRCLMKVTANSDNAWSVSAHGGASALLKICGSGCDDLGGELVGLACGVLRNLIGVDEIKRFVVEEGAIPMSIKLVRSKNEASQISAIDFIQVMASGNEFVRGLIVKEGGIRVLVRVLDPKSSYSSKAREKSMRALMSLCSDSIGCMNSLKTYSFMDHILHFLHDGEVPIQESALRAASWLSGTSDELKKAMGDAGFMPEIVKFLDAKSFEAREIAAETLSNLLVVPRNQKRFVQNDQNVNFLLQLMDPNEGSNSDRKVVFEVAHGWRSETCEM
ncbi:Armadillo [Cynara cardunculus var. scolymus]|uniref:Armadillo n=1 Tax=Cynara cardunculus var. scolymus TaxID=59895 RepID=A0A118JX45_CYNCS|nr:Armadillo [Cynara cardunculus var. scolymus]